MTSRRRWPWLVLILLLALAAVPALFAVPDLPAAELKAKYTNGASEFVTIAPGLAVHVRDEGRRDGSVLVLLHGSNASLQTWEPWVARLGDSYRIISLDFPGHGLTGVNPSGDYSQAAYANVVSQVLVAKKINRLVLAGNSMGGGVAWLYASLHPEQISGLILVDAAGAVSKTPSSLPIGFRIARTPVLRDLIRNITPRAMIEKSIRQTLAVDSVITPAMIDRYWELLRYPGNRAATTARFTLPRSAATPEQLARITAPVLILWGRDDHLIPVDSAQWFAEHLSHARVVLYDGVGHAPMEEAPDRTARDVRTFIDALQPQLVETAAK